MESLWALQEGWIYKLNLLSTGIPKAQMQPFLDIEVILDVKSAFYHMNYMLEGGSRALK